MRDSDLEARAIFLDFVAQEHPGLERIAQDVRTVLEEQEAEAPSKAIEKSYFDALAREKVRLQLVALEEARQEELREEVFWKQFR